MSLIVPPGFGLASWIFTGAQGTQPFVTTCGVTLVGGEATSVDAANALFNLWETFVLPQQANYLTLDRVQLFVGDDGPSGSVDSTESPAAGGRSAADPPVALSAIIRKGTDELGRRGRGRMFVPGLLSETAVDPDGTIVASRRNEISTFMDNFRTNVEASTEGVDGLVLLHSQAPADPSPITQLVCSDLVGWIRGRIR